MTQLLVLESHTGIIKQIVHVISLHLHSSLSIPFNISRGRLLKSLLRWIVVEIGD